MGKDREFLNDLSVRIRALEAELEGGETDLNDIALHLARQQGATELINLLKTYNKRDRNS